MESEVVPSSLVGEIAPILDVANEIEPEDRWVAHLCRFYAFEKSHKLDQTSRGIGVRAFKTSLLQRLEREADTLGRRRKSEALIMQDFYRYYYGKYIQPLQNADKPDRTPLKKAYEIAAVLFEVLKDICLSQSVEVTEEILKAHAEVVEKAKVYTTLIESSNQSLVRQAEMKLPNHLKIPLQVIKDCTQEFNEKNFIGKGGYGRVYKGILTWRDYVNQLVAIKRLDFSGFQGNKEFNTELIMLSQYHHENIITLIGFCNDNKEMILVYEYASRGSLDIYLNNNTAMSSRPSWPQLLNICIGVASALDYLHNHVAEKHRIIHRDVKSANILLDENWNAKLADFGLSRIGLANQENTFVITNLAGTHGYCDPQYEKTGFLTKESDVFSFGVLLFEILCGRLACVFSYHDERRFLYHLARTCYKKGELDKIIDQRIMKDIKPRTLLKFSAIAYQCLQETREDRPTIAEVAFQLKDATKVQLEDEINQDEIFQFERNKQGRLGRLKSKVRLRFCGCLKKQ